jgi:hypothetical protein
MHGIQYRYYAAVQYIYTQYKTYNLAVKTQQFIIISTITGLHVSTPRVIIRPSNEPDQDYLITSALWGPVGPQSALVIR